MSKSNRPASEESAYAEAIARAWDAAERADQATTVHESRRALDAQRAWLRQAEVHAKRKDPTA